MSDEQCRECGAPYYHLKTCSKHLPGVAVPVGSHAVWCRLDPDHDGVCTAQEAALGVMSDEQQALEQRPVACAVCKQAMYYADNSLHEPELVVTVDVRDGDYSHKHDGGGLFYVHTRCAASWSIALPDLAPVAQPPIQDATLLLRSWLALAESRPPDADTIAANLAVDTRAFLALLRCGPPRPDDGSECAYGVCPRPRDGCSEYCWQHHASQCAASPRLPSPQSEEIAREIVKHFAPKADIESSLQLWALVEAIASALTSAQQRGAELQREVDAKIVNDARSEGADLRELVARIRSAKQGG